MLKTTGAELKFISDNEMYLFFEEDMGGGISYIAKRYSKANNKYMKLYDDSKSTKYITYLDANNMHGWVMSQYLTHIGFKWLNQKDMDGFDVDLVNENSSHGYILEVALRYPDDLHGLLNDYPLAPE